MRKFSTLVSAFAISLITASTLVRAGDDLIVMASKLDQVMQPKSTTDTFVDCTKNPTCKAIIDAAAAYVGVDSTQFTSAVALIAESRAGEEARFAYRLPPGYQYCRAKVETISVVPATGDRASFMSIDADAREVRAYTWTPIQNLGEGKSWIEATFTIIGVRDGLAQQYRTNGNCSSKFIRAECRGARGTNKGSPACGVLIDEAPVRAAVTSNSVIRIAASSFVRGTNVAIGQCGSYGAGVLLNAAPCTSQSNAAEFDFNVPTARAYRMLAEYASASSRPVRMKINGTTVFPSALSDTTGCWQVNCQRAVLQGSIWLEQGRNTLRIESDDVFPHIRGFQLE